MARYLQASVLSQAAAAAAGIFRGEPQVVPCNTHAPTPKFHRAWLSVKQGSPPQRVFTAKEPTAQRNSPKSTRREAAATGEPVPLLVLLCEAAPRKAPLGAKKACVYSAYSSFSPPSKVRSHEGHVSQVTSPREPVSVVLCSFCSLRGGILEHLEPSSRAVHLGEFSNVVRGFVRTKGATADREKRPSQIYFATSLQPS